MNENRREEDVKLYLINNAKYFEQAKIPYIKEKLMGMNEDQFMLAASIDFKDPTMMLVISVLVGSLGVDRFMLGDIGMGILKLLTFGLCGVLTIIDWFSIQKRTRENNLNKLMLV
ncbi:MAG: TM2 domain-containing protein [Erysipelotrichales bacterium]